MLQLVCVPPDRVPEMWPMVEPLIRVAVNHSINTDLSTVISKLANRQALLWLVVKDTTIMAAVVTSISSPNGNKRCIIVACGGSNMDEWLPLIGQIEDYAAAEGCASVVIMGRRGWQRKLKDYRPVAVTLERKLNG